MTPEAKQKKLTLNAKLENNSFGSQTKKLTLKAKLEGPQVKTYGGNTTEMAIDANLWW